MRTQCISDLQHFQTFRNCCLFWTFRHIRNFYSGDAHHANYGKRSLDHHFQHCAHSVYQILRIFKVFKIALCFAHFAFYEISTPEMRNMRTMANSLNHPFLHCANFLYEICSVFKVFEIAACFAHFGLFEISTPFMSNMFKYGKQFKSSFPTLRTLCIRDLHSFRTSQNCGFVLHILSSSKFELRWFTPCLLWWTLFKSSFQTLRTVCIWHLQCFENFRNCCLFCTFWRIRNFYSGEAHHANYGKHSLNHHFQHCAQCIYETYSVFKVFQIAISFAHFSFYEISTPVMRHMPTMANIV